MNRPGAEPEVYRITGARRSHTEDLDRRINRYLFSMAVRTACVVLAVVVGGPLRWVFAVGAVFLPYVAVVLANASDRRSGTAAPPVERRGLAPGEGGGADRAGGADGSGGRGVVLEGQLLPGPGASGAPPAGPPGRPPG